MKRIALVNRKWIARLIFLGGLIWFIFLLPKQLFIDARSTVVLANDGSLLSATISEDGQWRFPTSDSIPYKFKQALLHFEDEHFYDHNGIYLPAIFRALKQNISSNEVVSGGSTLTMQVIRISRKNPPRTSLEKLLEMTMALRLECTYSKDEILSMYANNAPYGGNVVGIEAAAWRYFGRSPDQLSWAESATLAVLPNAPSLIFPGKNQDRLREKRNRLLLKLFHHGLIDEETVELSFLEPLPQKPFPLPQHAPHLLQHLTKREGKGLRHYTTIDPHLQTQVADIAQRHLSTLESNEVHNIAILVVEVKTGNVISYVGNTRDAKNRYSNMVDIIQARRSTGSILKPFLFAAMLQEGRILPHTLIPDIPIEYDGFAPQNYSETFDGAVPANRALSRSLNIPSVILLRDYGYPRFYHFLKKLPLSTLNQPADHYGLSIILGGAEGTLWDITHAYASMSRTLVRYYESSGKYYKNTYTDRFLTKHENGSNEEEKYPLLSAGAIYATYQSLLEVNRPESELGWEAYSSGQPIAWKTGTSFGNRDAWAVGTTPEYVVGVWVGNADGQGRPELTGLTAAAPILFDVFDYLPNRSWFKTPFDDLAETEVCRQSGMLATDYCTERDTVYVPTKGLESTPCRYHQIIHLNATGDLQVNSSCYNTYEMQNVPWFILPPVQAYYYASHHPEYKVTPPFDPNCQPNDRSPIGLIYPKSNSTLYIPKNLAGTYEKVVLEATHELSDATIYWHIDNVFIGETKKNHQLEIHPTPGSHILTLVDDRGNQLEKRINVVAK
ncbi:MAG: hypothetical protein RLZZ77_1210 [Bacteroidota bacterium]